MTGGEITGPGPVEFISPESSVRPHGLASQTHGFPVQWCLPENYEPGYAYPLIVYFHDDGGNERDLISWWPCLGRQNFLGMALRAPLTAAVPLPGRYRWSARRRPLYQSLSATISELYKDWNIHPERITLMGEGAGALLAMKIWLRYSRSFSGAVALHPPRDWAERLHQGAQQSPAKEQLGGRLCLITESQPDATELAVLGQLQAAHAGIQRTCLPAGNRMLIGRFINRWLLSAIDTAVF